MWGCYTPRNYAICFAIILKLCTKYYTMYVLTCQIYCFGNLSAFLLYSNQGKTNIWRRWIWWRDRNWSKFSSHSTLKSKNIHPYDKWRKVTQHLWLCNATYNANKTHKKVFFLTNGAHIKPFVVVDLINWRTKETLQNVWGFISRHWTNMS